MEPGAEAEPEGEDAGDRTLDSVRENRGSGGKAPRCETEKRVRSIVNSHVRAPLPRVSGAHPRRSGPVHTPGRFPSPRGPDRATPWNTGPDRVLRPFERILGFLRSARIELDSVDNGVDFCS